MIVDLTREEIDYLLEKLDLSKQSPIDLMDYCIVEKLKATNYANTMSVEEAVNKLHGAVKANSGVSDDIKDFLLALQGKHEVNLSRFGNLDNHNFESAVVLLRALKTEDAFEMWDRLHEVGLKGKKK